MHMPLVLFTFAFRALAWYKAGLARQAWLKGYCFVVHFGARSSAVL